MAGVARPDRRRVPRLTRTRILILAAASRRRRALLIERTAHHHVHAYAIAIGGAAIAAVVLLRVAGLVRAIGSTGRAERLARREAGQAQQLSPTRTSSSSKSTA
jgi:hypothetical protein